MQLNPPVTDFEAGVIAQAYFDSLGEAQKEFFSASKVKEQIQSQPDIYADVVLVFRAGVQHGRTLVNPSL